MADSCSGAFNYRLFVTLDECACGRLAPMNQSAVICCAKSGLGGLFIASFLRPLSALFIPRCVCFYYFPFLFGDAFAIDQLFALDLMPIVSLV